VANFATSESADEHDHCSIYAVDIHKERKALMKTTKLVMLVMTIAVALFILIPNLSWAADDGAALYKAKCAACHGPDGAGKPAAKIPSLIGDEAKKASDADLAKDVTEKPKHAGVAKSLTPDQVKLVISYIRDLQKK
jgi:mono/diheme cytochrome c family protein